MSPDGELVSTEPLPPSPDDSYLHSPDSIESDTSSQDSPESPSELLKQEDTLIVFPDSNPLIQTTTTPKEQKEDIVKQAMRCSNISFDDEIQLAQSHVVNVIPITNEKVGSVYNEHNNNIEDVKNVVKTCSVDTVLTFQYAAAMSGGNGQHLDTTVVDPNSLVMMY